MNQINTSNVNDSLNREQPFLAPSLAFVQASTIEALNNIVVGLLGASYSTSTPYVLFGCIRSGAIDGASSGSVSITAGAIFYNGEVFTVPAFSGTMASANAVYFTLTTTNTSPDPVTFSDGSSFNVHNIRQMDASVATSGTFPQSYCQYNSFAQKVALQSTSSNPSVITPSDGIVRLYYVSYRGTATLFNNPGDIAQLTTSLNNSYSGGFVMDTCTVRLSNSGGSGAYETIQTVVMQTIKGILPGTTISVSHNTTGTSGTGTATLGNEILSITEL